MLCAMFDGMYKQTVDDEELLFKQVQMTAAATPGTTVWVYRCSVYAYPWYTSVRKILEDPAYEAWYVHLILLPGPLFSMNILLLLFFVSIAEGF